MIRCALRMLLLTGLSVSVQGVASAHAAPEKGKAVVADAAAEGARELAALRATFEPFARKQPYGKKWRQIITVDPAPRDKTGLASAKTHPDLKHDPIEMQEQIRFERPTAVEVRYGFVLIRGVQIFRYGVLTGVELILERIGREGADRPRFEQDLLVIRTALAKPLEALGLTRGYKVVRNDLESVDPRPLPLGIELAPVSGARK